MAYPGTTFAHRLFDIGKILMLLGVVVVEVVNCSEAGGPRVHHISWWLAVGFAAGAICLSGLQSRLAERQRVRYLADAINVAARTRPWTYEPDERPLALPAPVRVSVSEERHRSQVGS
jgi:hypothetical protein